MPDEQLETQLSSVTVVQVDASTSDELLRRVAQWDAAVRDRDEAAAADVLTADFAVEMVHPVRGVMTRAMWLEVLPDQVVTESEVEEQVVDVDGDAATLLRRVRVQASVMGEDRSGVFVVSDLWRRVDGEWRLWRRHSTPLMAGPRPGEQRPD